MTLNNLELENSELRQEITALKAELRRWRHQENQVGTKFQLKQLKTEVRDLAEIAELAYIFVSDSYRPEPKYDAVRFDNLKEAVGNYQAARGEEKGTV